MARLLDERVPAERLVLERGVVERAAVERAAVERDAVERDPLDRDPDARALDAREPEARDAVERLVLREVPELARELLRVARELEGLAFAATAWRSLSKSLSACLLVLAASRRSVRSAAVTSL